MAKSEGDEGNVFPMSNDKNGSAAFGADMQAAAKEILQIDEKISALSKKRAEVRAKYVKANDVKLRDFNTIFRLWKLEDDERNQSVEAMQRTAAALDVQGDLFSSAG